MKLNTNNIKKRYKKATKAVGKKLSILAKYPLVIMAVVLVLLLGLIIAGDMIREKDNQPVVVEEQTKQVDTYRIGTAPTVKVLGKVEKKHVTKIVAQTGGIVQKIYVKEGDHIPYKGQNLAYISSNYQGGSALTIQRQLAQKQYENTEATYDTQKEIIAKQRDIAVKTDENSDELRQITKDSIDETKDLISMNEDILNYIQDDLDNYEATNSANVNRDDIVATKKLKASYQSAINSLRAGLRSSEYSSDDDNPPAQLSNLSKDMTLKQLELQEKALDLSKEISKLNLNLARINESLAYPASFSNGDVEKVHVREGQMVAPGQVLFTISGCEKAAGVTAYVSKQVAHNVSQFDTSTIYFDNTSVAVMPTYVSHEATQGQQYSVEYTLTEDLFDQISDNEYVEIEIPVGQPDTTSIAPFIPIDAVYQSSEGAYLFLLEDGVTRSRKATLGNVYGQYVEVKDGLESSDVVILNRNVVEGDLVKVN